MNMIKHLAACLAIALAGCGGADSPDNARLLVIGNSIAITPSWGRGMAASARSADFAHLTAAALDMPVTAVNMATLERDPSAAVPDFKISPETVVVVELGDNGLPAKYAELLAKVNGGAKLACVSTWWWNPERDAVIEAECLKAGGAYAFIGDLRARSEDPVGVYDDPDVDSHPKDWGMRMIADRVIAALLTPR